MKTVLITGASGGIGSAIAKKFAKNKYKLLLFYNSNKSEILKLTKSFNENVEFEIFKCNLTNSVETEKVLTKCLKTNNIDCLINCAGVSSTFQIQDVNEENYNYVMDSNFKSCVFVTKQVAKQMIENKSGKIINISSMWGIVGSSCESIYSASKSAMNALTLSLAKELGPSNINVNSICPGLIDTKMNACYSKEDLNEIKNSTPLNKIGKPEDVANLTAFLASEEANFITGQIITIDGGLTL